MIPRTWKTFGLFCTLLILTGISCNPRAKEESEPATEVDICIYGGTSAGVMAAYAARNMGKKVLLIEPGSRLGGMSSGGLGYTDIGNKYAITGLARDFYRRVGEHYGVFEQWIFEPRVADSIFRDYIRRGQVTVWYRQRLQDVRKDGNRVQSLVLENTDTGKSRNVRARMFLDCTYEGDLMARSGISYRVGREANAEYGETYNGVQLMDGHQFPDGIDPYKVPGDPSSGLLWGVQGHTLQPPGSGDSRIQAYNFRICLTDNPDNRIPIEKPPGYDPEKYELLLRLMQKNPWKSLQDGFIWSEMPNRKTDINNRNGFSTDMIGMNWAYPEADYELRDSIWQAHTDYTKGLLYFVGHDPRVAAPIREAMQQWGYPRDEYTDTDHWTPQLYVREARRMVGALVMTQHHCLGEETVTDGVGMAAYTMDSHNCDRLVVDGMVKNEGNVEIGGFGPYPISYRALVPKKEEASNVLVPVCLSATHIAYGSIRMEPVFMVLGQSAGMAASMAIDAGSAVQDIDISKLQRRLRIDPLADGTPPDILVDDADSTNLSISGDWTLKRQGGYGPTYLSTRGGEGAKKVRFNPTLPREGTYNIYLYCPKQSNGSSRTRVVVYDGQQPIEREIDHTAVAVVGQTSGEWVSLGDYQLPKGRVAYVEVDAGQADGLVTADAVLFVPRTPVEIPEVH